ncbi:MAG: hypothetical protein OJF50_002567 [Nitrospira sp.]|nr:hypothetical protein [Nitrospira sp.]
MHKAKGSGDELSIEGHSPSLRVWIVLRFLSMRSERYDAPYLASDVSIKRHLRAKRNRIDENNRFKTRKKIPLLTRSRYMTPPRSECPARGSSYEAQPQ